MSEQHKPDPEFVEYLKKEVNNPFLSAATVLRMEQVFIWQREKYEAILAARAQGGQGAEPIGFTWDAGRFGRQFTADAGVADRVRADGVAVLPVYTQPQPAVPEGWRECLTEMVQAMHDYEMSVDEDAPYKHRAMMDRAHTLLSTPTTPQADGWVRVPEGWAVVPIKPTKEMKAVCRVAGKTQVWDDMMAARPEVPSE